MKRSRLLYQVSKIALATRKGLTIVLCSILFVARLYPQKTLIEPHILSDSLGSVNILFKHTPTLNKFSLYSLNFLCELVSEGYRKIKGYKLSDKILKKYPVVKFTEQKYYIGALIMINEKFRENELTKYNVLVGAKVGNIISVKIPVENFEYLAEIEGIDYIDIDVPVEPNMNLVREFTKANYVHQGYGFSSPYTGKGVIVGVIDVGFDFTHPIFKDTTLSKYRIQRLWDMGDNTGIPPTGYTYGTEVVGGVNIYNRLYDVLNETHGTHVTGIAAGGFSGNPSIYKGIAPESDIVIVANPIKSGTRSAFIDGIKYIFDYASKVRKPAVVNLSWGADIGPHDGTSLFDKAVDQLVGEGKIIVGSVGNRGGSKMHIGKTFSLSDSILYTFLEFPNRPKKTNGRAVIDIWGEANKHFKVWIGIYNINSNVWEDIIPQPINSFYGLLGYAVLKDKDIFSPDSCVIIFSSDPQDSLNGKPHVLIDIDNVSQDDNYKYVIIKIVSYNTSLHAWASGDTSGVNFEDKGYAYPVKPGDDNYTLVEIGGTAKSIISVGAYTTKNVYIDFRGNIRTIPFNSNINDIAPFSSKGPTVDGRIKPDITAPGNVVVSAVSRFDSKFSSNSPTVVSGVTDGTNTWWFAALQGTSMAAPVVTGIISLMLEANPNLTPFQIKQILQNSSITDAYTEVVPNNIWGWGKINAYQAISSIIGKKIAKLTFIEPHYGRNSSIATGVSYNGAVVCGYSVNAMGIDNIDYNTTRAFRWDEQTGTEDLGSLGLERTWANAVSGDGKVIVGGYYTGSYAWRAFRWTRETGCQDLGSLGIDWVNAIDVSYDGSVIVGESYAPGDYYWWAVYGFIWTPTTGMKSLGKLPGYRFTTAHGVSKDGNIIVGFAFKDAAPDWNKQEAWIWNNQTGIVGIGSLSGWYSQARGVSPDGSAVIGVLHNGNWPDPYQYPYHSFLWKSNMGMRDLGTLGGDKTWVYHAVTQEGKVIYGASTYPSGEWSAFRWSEEKGMEDLNLLFYYVIPSGWVLRSVNDCSPDGRYIVGVAEDYFNKKIRGFLLDIGQPIATVVESKDINIIVEKFEVYQNYPNPFNSNTIIEFKAPGRWKLKIINILGQVIDELEGDLGHHKIRFDGSKLSSGVYFYEIYCNGYSEIKKMMLIK